MAVATKRAWKLQEFVAHGSNVNCAALGRKTGRVLATGGDDRKVNLWTVGKPNCIMSLSGHTSSVEAVHFGNNEEMVVAGSMSGALKIWDLEQTKIIRTLTGHKSNIRCLDFHPYGDFVASGSLDTNVKLWDIRRKGCIFTYKGHGNGITCLRFSPDGRWIASASEDSSVKIWDLAAGKLLTELRQHTAAVNSIEFHPSEYLLASGSSDRSIKFWELERFQCIDSTDYDNNAIRSVLFHPEGSCIFSGSNDLLKVYGWEPCQPFDSLNMGWGKVVDMAITQGQLIGVSINQTNISTYVVDLTRVAPIGQVPGTPNPPLTASGRRNFTPDRQIPSSAKPTVPKPAEEPEEQTTADDGGDDASSTADVKDRDAYEQVFNPKNKFVHSPPQSLDPFPAPKEEDVKRLAGDFKAGVNIQGGPLTYRAAGDNAGRAQVMPSKYPGNQPPISIPSNLPDKGQQAALDPKDFLPAQPSYSVLSDVDATGQISKGHSSMNTLLSVRSKNLQIVRALWSSGNIKTALESAIQMKDDSVIVDILNVLNDKPLLWSLDVAAVMITYIKKLIVSKYESHVSSSCESLKLVLRTFGGVIKQNLITPDRLGVDITAEERHRKCMNIYRGVQEIRIAIEGKQYQTGKLAATFKEIQLLLNQLDT